MKKENSAKILTIELEDRSLFNHLTAEWNISEIFRIYLTYPSGQEPIESIWKGEADFGR